MTAFTHPIVWVLRSLRRWRNSERQAAAASVPDEATSAGLDHAVQYLALVLAAALLRTWRGRDAIPRIVAGEEMQTWRRSAGTPAVRQLLACQLIDKLHGANPAIQPSPDCLLRLARPVP